MTLLNLIESIDGPCAVGFICLELIFWWIAKVEGPQRLPPPQERCITSRHERIWISGLLK